MYLGKAIFWFHVTAGCPCVVIASVRASQWSICTPNMSTKTNKRYLWKRPIKKTYQTGQQMSLTDSLVSASHMMTMKENQKRERDQQKRPIKQNCKWGQWKRPTKREPWRCGNLAEYILSICWGAHSGKYWLENSSLSRNSGQVERKWPGRKEVMLQKASHKPYSLDHSCPRQHNALRWFWAQ